MNKIWSILIFLSLLVVGIWKFLISRLIHWDKPIELDFGEQEISEWRKSAEKGGKIKAPELIRSNGYPVETHKITTKDGYILIIHRIPNGRNQDKSSRKKRVALLQHGLVGSSIHWLFNTPDKALPYMLADSGYDVWMPNARGNFYTRKHVKYTPKEKAFWDFSWGDMGAYDVPASIEYVLEQTGQEKLYYIGYSMGSTSFFVTMSLYPQLNSKIHLMAALGPAVYLYHMTSPVRYLSKYSKVVLDALGNGELLPKYIIKLIDAFTPNLYSPQLKDLRIYENLMFALAGFDYDQFNQKFVRLIMDHTPTTSSTKCLIHYLQVMNSNKFAQYDHGMLRNLFKYGSFTPPKYDLANVQCPVALYYGKNDWICVPKDVKRLAEELPNLAEFQEVPFEKWNHLDFILGKDNGPLVHEPLMRLMEKF